MPPKIKKSIIRDFDPESLLDPAPSSSSEDENSTFSDAEDQDAGREHYSDVGKSRLRKKEVVPLGPQYTGSRIGREQLEDEDSDDPFARPVFDVEGGSEDNEEIEEDDEDGHVHVNGNGVAHSDEEISQTSSDEDDLLGGDDGSNDDLSDDHSEGEDEDEDDDEDQNAELRRMMKDDASDEDEEDDGEEGAKKISAKAKELYLEKSSVTGNISAAANADVEKGQAVRTQKKAFDSLLNTRIRLQKALISANSLSADAHAKSPAPEDAISAAEHAALKLLNSITSLRATLDSTRTGQKRKRSTFTSETPSREILVSIKSSEKSALTHRRAILEKWSQKTKSANTLTQRSRLNASAEQTLSSVLQSQLSDPTHLIQRTQTPRSCAPLQSAAGIQSSPSIYDDADFYGLLLKELLESHSNGAAGAAEFVVQAPWQVAREAKTKKVVDTKASKGRKLRYTVHEKLQNFMAPEDRGLWGDRQREELFSSLFGRRLGLGEEVEDDSDGEGDRVEEGLMLFGS
ncbi:apoptosis-antagonizing transcription factor [Lophiotrema nucula]|uniref:Protein BFR2 n=1 Tax=Lophiotrema nucula TaxID=690887 RepID=A0A6A5YFB8_9PLEO|nr:apoptosis-antagonizing transcription factor [Lophiotrema nucula]